MNTIEFSHNYSKLNHQTHGYLLAVLPIFIDNNTPLELIEYNAKFDGGYFGLKHGPSLQLVFIGDKRIPFCTIEKDTPKNREKYMNKIMQLFVFKIKSETEEKQ